MNENFFIQNYFYTIRNVTRLKLLRINKNLEKLN